MTATRASKRSAAKSQRGLNSSPSSRTRSHTQRDRICGLLATVDPAAITRAVKVLEAYGAEQLCSLHQPEGGRLMARRCGSHRITQGSASSGWGYPSGISYAPNIFKTAVSANSSAANSSPATFMASSETNCMGSRSAWGKLEVSFASTDDMQRFKENVLVVKGVIGSITEFDGHQVDGIVFPTISSLCNFGTGAPAAMMRRTDNGLTSYVQRISPLGTAGTEPATARFGASVSALAPKSYTVLESTYTSIMEATQREDLKCITVASISRGNYGVPCNDGARVALCAIQRFLARGTWSGVVAIVCSEQKVFDAFTQEKQAMLDAFIGRDPSR